MPCRLSRLVQTTTIPFPASAVPSKSQPPCLTLLNRKLNLHGGEFTDNRRLSHSGFFKFTTQIAYQTPCFSSFKAKMTPPPVTLGLPNNPTDLSKPTSAINNLVWAMGYNMTEPSSGLSQAATIGIGVGAGVFGIALIGLLAVVFIRIRRSKKAALAERNADGGTVPPASPPMQQYHHSQVPGLAQQQQQQQYNRGSSWNQGYGDYGQYDLQPQQQPPGVYDNGYRR